MALKTQYLQTLIEQKEMERKIDEILERTASLSQIREDVAEMKRTLEKLELTIEKLEYDNTINQQHINKLNKHVEHQERRISDFDRAKRRNNLIFFKVPEVADENMSTTLGTIKEILEKAGMSIEEAQIDWVKRIGRKNSNSPRPICLSFCSQLTKMEVSNKSKEIKKLGFSVSWDHTKEEREARRKLVDKQNELKAKGIKAEINKGKLLVNGQTLDQGSTPIRKATRAFADQEMESQADPCRAVAVTFSPNVQRKQRGQKPKGKDTVKGAMDKFVSPPFNPLLVEPGKSSTDDEDKAVERSGESATQVIPAVLPKRTAKQRSKKQEEEGD